MHFGKQLKFLAREGWKNHYIDFALLKKKLKDILKEAKATGRVQRVEVKRGGAESARSSLDMGRRSMDQPRAEGATAGRKVTMEETSEVAMGLRPSIDIAHYEMPGAKSESEKSEADADWEVVSMGSDGMAEEEEVKYEDVVELTYEWEQDWLDLLYAEKEKVSDFFVLVFMNCAEMMTKLFEETDERQKQNLSLVPLKKNFFDILNDIEELLDFARLNLVGFTKIVKKFARRTDFARREETMEIIRQAVFVTNVPALEQLGQRIRALYADTFSDGTPGIHEKLIQEITQSVQAARSWKMNTILFEVDQHNRKAVITERKQVIKPIPVIVATLILAFFYFVPIMSETYMPAQRCLGILIAASLLWLTEAWPLFVTALLVVLLCSVSKVLLDDNMVPLDPKEGVSMIFKKMFSNSITLVFAGYAISAAFKKYGIDIALARSILSLKIFQTPHRFLIAVELLCFFMSMWVSNMAASVLTLTVIMPVIRDLPQGCNYAKALIIATSLAGNVGGMTTQIASPQNAITVSLGEYSIDFLSFMGVAWPAWIIILFFGHIFICIFFKIDVTTLPSIEPNNASSLFDAELASSTESASAALDAVRSQHSSAIKKKKPFPVKAACVVGILLLSIGLWIASNWLTPFGCDIGIISLIPIVLFFATGLLDKDDFEELPLALMFLLCGGSVLGYAVESSKLLTLIADLLLKLPSNTFVLVLVSNAIMLIVATFVSSTVSALILLKLSVEIGIPVGHPQAIVMTNVIVCSGAMSLPVSSFPNMNAASVEDENGQTYLKSTDFVKFGLAVTVVSYIASSTAVYGMALLLGF